MTAPRLRQLVIAAETLETADRLGLFIWGEGV